MYVYMYENVIVDPLGFKTFYFTLTYGHYQAVIRLLLQVQIEPKRHA